MIDRLLALVGPLGELLDGLKPALLDRAIAAAEEHLAALETLRTVQSVRRAADEAKRPPPAIIAVATMLDDPAAAKRLAATDDGERIAAWLRTHEPATTNEIARATGVSKPAVRQFLKAAAKHDQSVPYRWTLPAASAREATDAA